MNTAPNSAATVAMKQRSEIAYSLKNFSILLVEDFDFMRLLISGMLKVFGVGNVVVCGSGNEAMRILSQSIAQVKSGKDKGIDIVLTDWMMPDGSGLELMDWMRNHKEEQIRFMPIVTVSSFANAETISKARDHGTNEVLVKPMSGEKLASRILSVIDHPRPFIKAPSFFGPDRRRRQKEFSGDDRRKVNMDQVLQHHERA